MKTPIVTLIITAVTAAAGALVWLNHPQGPSAPANFTAVADAAPSSAVPAALTTIAAVPKPEAPLAAVPAPVKLAPVATTVPALAKRQPRAFQSVHESVDALLSTASRGDKQALFDQLRKAGQLDQVVADLKQRMIDNPGDPAIPTTLGEAQMNQLRAVLATGGDYNKIGILAMQADQNFDAALQIDPKNWEAQLVKSSAMYYWPANPQTDNSVVQNLSSLIDQQATMTPLSDFAQTYLVLGNEYQKIGQPDAAQSTWELGLQKFPNDAGLQKKLGGQ